MLIIKQNSFLINKSQNDRGKFLLNPNVRNRTICTEEVKVSPTFDRVIEHELITSATFIIKWDWSALTPESWKNISLNLDKSTPKDKAQLLGLIGVDLSRAQVHADVPATILSNDRKIQNMQLKNHSAFVKINLLRDFLVKTNNAFAVRELDTISMVDAKTINSGLSDLTAQYPVIKEALAVVSAIRVIALDRNPFQEAMMSTPEWANEYKRFQADTAVHTLEYQNTKAIMIEKKTYNATIEKHLLARWQNHIAGKWSPVIAVNNIKLSDFYNVDLRRELFRLATDGDALYDIHSPSESDEAKKVLPVLAGFVLRETQASIKAGSTDIWTNPEITKTQILSQTISDYGTIYEVNNFINSQKLVYNVVKQLRKSGKL